MMDGVRRFDVRCFDDINQEKRHARTLLSIWDFPRIALFSPLLFSLSFSSMVGVFLRMDPGAGRFVALTDVRCENTCYIIAINFVAEVFLFNGGDDLAIRAEPISPRCGSACAALMYDFLTLPTWGRVKSAPVLATAYFPSVARSVADIDDFASLAPFAADFVDLSSVSGFVADFATGDSALEGRFDPLCALGFVSMGDRINFISIILKGGGFSRTRASRSLTSKHHSEKAGSAHHRAKSRDV